MISGFLVFLVFFLCLFLWQGSPAFREFNPQQERWLWAGVIVLAGLGMALAALTLRAPRRASPALRAHPAVKENAAPAVRIKDRPR